MARGEAFDKPESIASDEGDMERAGKGSVWLLDSRRLDDSLKVRFGVCG